MSTTPAANTGEVIILKPLDGPPAPPPCLLHEQRGYRHPSLSSLWGSRWNYILMQRCQPALSQHSQRNGTLWIIMWRPEHKAHYFSARPASTRSPAACARSDQSQTSVRQEQRVKCCFMFTAFFPPVYFLTSCHRHLIHHLSFVFWRGLSALKPLKIYYSVFLHPRDNKEHHNSFQYPPPTLWRIVYVSVCVQGKQATGTTCQLVF